MNRRDAALIAHLDAIDARTSAHLDGLETRVTGYLMQIIGELGRVREDVAGMKVDLATHRHDDE